MNLRLDLAKASQEHEDTVCLSAVMLQQLLLHALSLPASYSSMSSLLRVKKAIEHLTLSILTLGDKVRTSHSLHLKTCLWQAAIPPPADKPLLAGAAQNLNPTPGQPGFGTRPGLPGAAPQLQAAMLERQLAARRQSQLAVQQVAKQAAEQV